MSVRTIRTATLEIAYEQTGPEDGDPVVLLHGFPYDVRGWDACVPQLAGAGCRVIVPWLRGYGPTRFLDTLTPRSGQQAALGADLLAMLDALDIRHALLAGYDWGGRAACIVAALWPKRVRGLVTANGYNVQNIPASVTPAMPEQEFRHWYQWYFHTERGRAGLLANRRDLCRLLWQLWSPNYQFDEATFERSAASFDNPDFVEVVIQSYRHRHRAAPGDPVLEPIERQLEAQPPIQVATVSLHGAADGVDPPGEADRGALHFTGYYRREIVPVAGHYMAAEMTEAVVRAVEELRAL